MPHVARWSLLGAVRAGTLLHLDGVQRGHCRGAPGTACTHDRSLVCTHSGRWRRGRQVVTYLSNGCAMFCPLPPPPTLLPLSPNTPLSVVKTTALCTVSTTTTKTRGGGRFSCDAALHLWAIRGYHIRQTLRISHETRPRLRLAAARRETPAQRRGLACPLAPLCFQAAGKRMKRWQTWQ